MSAVVECPSQSEFASLAWHQLANNGSVAGDRDVHHLVGHALHRDGFATMVWRLPSIWCPRCISFESRGFPETVCAPETTQLLDPTTRRASDRDTRVKSSPTVSRSAGAEVCCATELLTGDRPSRS